MRSVITSRVVCNTKGTVSRGRTVGGVFTSSSSSHHRHHLPLKSIITKPKVTTTFKFASTATRFLYNLVWSASLLATTTGSGRYFLNCSSSSITVAAAAAAASFSSSSSSSASSFGMSHTTQRDGSGTITVAPANEAEQSALVVISHGLGDTAEGFVDVAEQLARQMPHIKFILPTAPTQPVTMNMGMPMPSWYDIVGLDERANENCKGIDVSKAKLERILADEHKATGLPYSRMVLAGFSQGGAMSLFTGLQLEESLAGIVVMSGYLPAAKQCKPKQFKTPIWHGHGTADPMVQYAMAEKTKQRVTDMGVESYTLESFPIPHSVSPQELQKMMQFVAKILPPDESCKIKLKDPAEMSVKELKAAIRKAGLGSKAVGLMEKSEFIKLLQDHRAGKL